MLGSFLKRSDRNTNERNASIVRRLTSFREPASELDRATRQALQDLFVEGFRATPGSLRIESVSDTLLPAGCSTDAFVWLRDLTSVRSELANREARERLAVWLDHGPANKTATNVDAARERLLAIILAADVLVAEHGASPLSEDHFDRLMEQVGLDIALLCTHWPKSATPIGRLTTLIVIVLATLIVAGHDAKSLQLIDDLRATFESVLVAEFDRQFFDDGGHRSRNPANALVILSELIPLIRTYAYLDRSPPDALLVYRKRLQAYLRTLRMCDRGLAPFNGGDSVRAQRLAVVLKLDSNVTAHRQLKQSGYLRIETGDLELLADGGGLTDAEYGDTAHAGFASFILGDAGSPLLVNCGSEPSGTRAGARRKDQLNAQLARATQSHNTLSFPNLSSSTFDAKGRMFGPRNAHASLSETENDWRLHFSHDGYEQDYGLRHIRHINVAKGGARVIGSDRLTSVSEPIRLPKEQAFAVHFHLADDIDVSLTPLVNTAVLTSPTGQRWRFTAENGQLYVEASARFGRSACAGSVTSQLVLRTTTVGESEVRWMIVRD